MPKLLHLNFLHEVVMQVVMAKFFTSPQPYPSGVSHGQIIPQWLPNNALGPAIFLVFSNWEFNLVIIPIAETKLILLSCWLTPFLSMWNLLITQSPVAIGVWRPLVKILALVSSKWDTSIFLLFLCLIRNLFSYILKSALKTLNLSSKSSSIRVPAHFILLLP